MFDELLLGAVNVIVLDVFDVNVATGATGVSGAVEAVTELEAPDSEVYPLALVAET